jgi:deoxyuridine 5'-triphosphate nucleotidohydrolase
MTLETAYCNGFFLNICDSHTDYSNNCYELANIDINSDNKVLKIFEDYSDVLVEEEVVSLTILNDSILEKVKKSLDEFIKLNDNQKRAFVRGLYEYSHLINEITNEGGNNTDIIIKRPSILLDKYVDEIFDFVNIPYVRESNTIIIKYGCSTVDFLGFLYTNINNELSIKSTNFNYLIPKCSFIKTDENAVSPSKTNWSDVGYDLSIIKKVKDINSRTSLYDTGIKIQLEFGYYSEIVPRSSIIKSGYMLSNSIGIIDNSYRGNLMIALTKIAEDANEIEYPFKCCQLIFKKQIYVNMEEVFEGKLDETKRNEGGFGSTDN